MSKSSSDKITITIPKKLIKVIVILLATVLVLYLAYQAFYVTMYFTNYSPYVHTIAKKTVITQEDIDKVTTSLKENGFGYQVSHTSHYIGDDAVVSINVKTNQMEKLKALGLPYDETKWVTGFDSEYPMFRWLG